MTYEDLLGQSGLEPSKNPAVQDQNVQQAVQQILTGQGFSGFKRVLKHKSTWRTPLNPAGSGGAFQQNLANINSLQQFYTAAGVTPLAGFHYPVYFNTDGRLDQSYIGIHTQQYQVFDPRVSDGQIAEFLKQAATVTTKTARTELTVAPLDQLPTGPRFEHGQYFQPNTAVGATTTVEQFASSSGYNTPELNGGKAELFILNGPPGLMLIPGVGFEVDINLTLGWSAANFANFTLQVQFAFWGIAFDSVYVVPF